MVPGPRAHIHEEPDEATCKWFDEKLDSKTGRPVLHCGKRAFHLTVNNPAGFNDEMIFANILAGVRMTLDEDIPAAAALLYCCCLVAVLLRLCCLAAFLLLLHCS